MINRAYNDFLTIKELRKAKGLFPQITLIPAEFYNTGSGSIALMEAKIPFG